MKKFLYLFLIPALVLSGCAQEELSPVLVVETPAPLAFNSTEGVIVYEVQNAERGISVDARADQDWIHDFDYSSDGEIRFAVDRNDGSGIRNAMVTVTYGPVEPVIVTVKQLSVAESGSAAIIVESETPLEAEPDGTEVLIEYEVENYVTGQEITAEADAEWANHFEYPEYGVIKIFPEVNFYESGRSANITLSYPNAEPVVIELIQKPAESVDDRFVINVTGVTEVEATVSWFPDDKNMTYVNGLVPKSVFDEYEGDYDRYIRDDIDYLKSEASRLGVELSVYLEGVLQKGDKGVKWSSLDPGTEYCAYAYGLDTDADILTRMTVVRFSTKSPEQLDCDFEFRLESSTDSDLSVRVIPSNENVRYYTGIISKADYETAGSDQAIMDEIVDYIDEEIWIAQLFQVWKQWSDFTQLGEYIVSAENLFSDTDYYAYAFGLEDQGLITTNFQKAPFTTNAHQITDDCTFEISSEVTTSYMADFDIVPSDPSTKYYVTCLTTEYFSSYSRSDLATILINEANSYEYDWMNGEYTFSGEQHLNSYRDLGINPLDPSTNYTLVLFGVDADGRRTTDVYYEQFRTGVLVPSDMTFGLGVTDVKTSEVTLTCEPSRDDELYVLGCMPVERYEEYGSDEAAIAAVVEYWSNSSMYYVTYSGQKNLPTQIDLFYNSIKPNTDYYVMAFGYMGAVTTGLTKVRFTTPGSDIPVSDASVDISYEILDGDDLVRDDPYTYPPEQWSDYAGAKITITPGEGTAGWYFVTFTNSFSEIYLMPTDQLIEEVKRYGSYKKTEALVKMTWNSSIVAVAVPEDAEGIYGKPVIVEIVAAYGAMSPYSVPLEFRPLEIASPDLTPHNVSSPRQFELKGYKTATREDFNARFGVQPRPEGIAEKPERMLFGEGGESAM